MEPARGLQLEPVCRSKCSAAWSRISSKASRRSIRVCPSAVRRSSSTDLTSLPSCSLCNAALRLLVIVEFAFDPVSGAVEEIDGRPEQIVEIGFEARVGKRGDQGVENIGDGAGDAIALGQGARIRFVGEGTIAVKLKLLQDMLGRRRVVARFEVVALVHGMLRRLDRARRGLLGAESRRAGTDLHPERNAPGPQRQRRMAKAGDFASRWKGGPARRRKIVGRSHCRSGPFAGRSPLSKALARLLPDG